MSKHKDTRIKIRRNWGDVNPVTKIKHSRKTYSRVEAKREAEKELESESELYEY